MRTEAESEQVDALARQLLKQRGVDPATAEYEELASMYEVAVAAVARGATTVAEALALGAITGAEDGSDEKMMGLLSKFAMNGQFVGDLSLTEEELLREAIKTQERQQADAVVAAEADGGAFVSDEYCPDCGYHIADYGCQCRRTVEASARTERGDAGADPPVRPCAGTGTRCPVRSRRLGLGSRRDDRIPAARGASGGPGGSPRRRL
jgi:hypothetical protein